MSTAEKVTLGTNSTPAYVFKPTNSTSYKGAIVICTDIFGIEMPNTHKRAQELADFGYLTILPDCLGGEPLTMELLIKDSNALPQWLETHGPQDSQCQDALQEATNFVQSKYNISPKNTFILGVCYGGKALLYSLSNSPLKENIKGGGMIAHGSFMKPEDLENVGVPILMIWAELDNHFKYSEFSESLEKFKNKIENEGKFICGNPNNFQLLVINEANHGFWAQTNSKMTDEATNHFNKFLQANTFL